ncbi:MAG TPA: hypothetical protein VMW10_02075 [Alphaproteobacteria bacterium]|nr:hypothetical protein [Alphaproteobacteria bacterium]
MKKNSISILGIALCLTGCMGVYEGGFECPPGEGVGCKSISEVNEMINHGELPKGDLPKGEILNQSLPDFSQVPCQCRSNPDAEIAPDHSQKPQIWYAPWVWEEA